MRVLHLNAGNLFGGIEVNLLTLARFQSSSPDLEADFGFCFDAKPAAELRKTGSRVHVLGNVRFSRPWTVWKARCALSEILREFDYETVICHESWIHALFAPVIRTGGRKLVLWIHDRPGCSRGWLHRLARRLPPDQVICNSRYSEETVGKVFPGVPCEVVYCPVGPLGPSAGFDRQATRHRFDTPADATVLIQVGRWEPHKGHIAHVEALGRLKGVPGWICWQVGSPQLPSEQAYQSKVRDTADRLGIADRVKFLGWQPSLGDILAASDVYCQPNIRPEPFGISIIEALYAGLPVVAAAEAGPLEIVTPECGLLVSPGNVDELSGAIKDLLYNSERRKMLGRNGPPRATSLCDPSQQVRRLSLCLSGLSSSPRARGGGKT